MQMRTKNSSTAGTTPATNTARQPHAGMISSATIAASARPTGNDAIIVPAMRPRMRAGLNSEASVSATGTSPPRPKFDRKRNTASDSTFHDAATSPVNTEKMPTVAANEVRRPM